MIDSKDPWSIVRLFAERFAEQLDKRAADLETYARRVEATSTMTNVGHFVERAGTLREVARAIRSAAE